MGRFKLYFVCLTMFGCTKPDYELFGTYQSHKPSFFEKVSNTLKYGKWTWGVGSELILNRDSTFDMTMCGNIIKGSWYVNKDTLFLCYQEMRYRIDSLNYIQEWKERLNNKVGTVQYLIEGESLEVIYKDKKKSMIMKMDKIKSVK